MRTMQHELAFIGAGNMAEAIAGGIIRGSVLKPSDMIAAEPNENRRDVFNKLGIRTQSEIDAAVGNAKIILLAVKPQVMSQVLDALKSHIGHDSLIISIAAGIPIWKIEAGLSPATPPVIRTMPNTPMLIGQGMIALAPGSRATQQHLDRATQLFAPSSEVRTLPENLIDAVTALSGSGPAYLFFLAENMIAAGIAMGMSPDDARTFTLQTLVGSAAMLKASDRSATELRAMVTSPNGTTHAAITHMQQNHMDKIIVDALIAARDRGKELGK